MQRALHNDIEIYNLTATKSIPDWISERRRRKLLKRDKLLAKQVNLIHEFEMPNLSTHVTSSPDQKYLFALGTYKPQVKCFEVDNMAEKFTRGVDSLPQKIEFVDADYSKFWLLEDDRWIEFHSRQGHYFKTRIPKPCRDISYFPPNNELYLSGAGDEIYRFHHSTGRFMPSLKSPGRVELTACTTSVTNGLLLCGTVDGKIDAWDPRARRCVSTLDIVKSAPGGTFVTGLQSHELPEVTCVKFKDNLNFGVGTSTGKILLFDIRKGEARLVKDHLYNFPIIDFAFHETDESPKIVSIDKKCVKIWDDACDAPTWASFEPGVRLNGLHLWKKSGLLHLANEDTKILSYFIPQLGGPPGWCSRLTSLLEECNEQEQTLYDDQKFISRKDLENWGLEELIGTEHLRAYMHGFFMNSKLYEKVRILTETSNKEYLRRLKINHALAQKRQEMLIQGDEQEKMVNKQLSLVDNDDRFQNVFLDPEFAIDPTSEEASKVERIARIKEKKERKRAKAREKAQRSNKILRSES